MCAEFSIAVPMIRKINRWEKYKRKILQKKRQLKINASSHVQPYHVTAGVQPRSAQI